MAQVIVYTVDDSDTIVDVVGGWDSFASTNNSACLRDTVIGRTIWNFIAVDEVVGLYQQLFRAVRRSQKSVTIHFRCDSEKVLRFMTMEIKPEPQNQVVVTTELIREVSRRQVLGREIIYMGIQGGTRMCSHCNKIYVSQVEQWMEIDYALALGYITGALNVNFRICETCISLFNAKIESIAG